MTRSKGTTTQGDANAPRRGWQRFVPLAVIVLAVVAFFASGLHRLFDFDALALNYAALRAWVADTPLVAFAAAFALYALAVALAFPITWILTVAIALVFGWWVGTILVVLAATLGASILYWAAATAFGDLVRERAGGALSAMAEGFRADAVNYMLFLRLAPVFPFALVNAVPGVLGVRYRVFALTTLVGIVPGTLAYAYAGEGLRSIVAARAEACLAGVPPCGTPLSAGDLTTPEIGIALGLLAVVSLIPVALRRLRKGRDPEKR